MAPRHRLFVATLPIGGGEIELDAAALKHLRVLRLGPGDAIELFDGTRRAKAHIDARGVCISEPAVEIAAPPKLVLVQALPKGGKLDDIVRMATEIGVSEIRLATSSRSVPRPNSDRGARLERLVRITREAARQAGRTSVPEVFAPAPLAEVAALAPPGAARIVVWEGCADAPFAPPPSDEAWVVVGPEGGLSPEEVEALEGYLPCGLGPFVLRVETAAPVALALAFDRLRQRANR